MQSANTGLFYGPIWLSKGERFRPSGAYAFLVKRYKEYQILLKKQRAEFREVVFVIRSRQKPGDSGALERDSSLERTEDDEPKIKETASIKNKDLLSLNTREINEYREVHWSNFLVRIEEICRFRHWKSKSKKFENRSSGTQIKWRNLKRRKLMRKYVIESTWSLFNLSFLIGSGSKLCHWAYQSRWLQSQNCWKTSSVSLCKIDLPQRSGCRRNPRCSRFIRMAHSVILIRRSIWIFGVSRRQKSLKHRLSIYSLTFKRPWKSTLANVLNVSSMSMAKKSNFSDNWNPISIYSSHSERIIGRLSVRLTLFSEK